MLTTADEPSHDEEKERDRLSLQNHVISFCNETSDEVKETILETSRFQGGDDGIMQRLRNIISPCTRPKERTPFHFMTSRRHWGWSSFVRASLGGQKITVTATIDLFRVF